MTIGLFLLIGGILNLIAFIVSLLLIDDIRIFAFIIFLFFSYTFAIGATSMGIVRLIEKIKE
jgi:hypothetical protein